MGRAKGKTVATVGKSSRGNSRSAAAAEKSGNRASGQRGKGKQLGFGAGHVKRKK